MGLGADRAMVSCLHSPYPGCSFPVPVARHPGRGLLEEGSISLTAPPDPLRFCSMSSQSLASVKCRVDKADMPGGVWKEGVGV